MKIALIGMSGTGKSFWSKRLEQSGFKRFGCDELIGARLTPLLRRSDGSQMRLGEWMGFPFEAQYEKCESIYLDAENQVMKEILTYSTTAASDEQIVIDTTGSVIYLDDPLLKQLKEATKVIYLETSLAVRAQMAEQYIRKPLAVLWRGHYSRQGVESVEQALSRSYQELINARTNEYSSLAHKTVPYEQHRDKAFGVSRLLGLAE